MTITPNLSDALRALSRAPNGRLTRAHRGFGHTGITNAPLITRRTANALVCAGLADFNDRFLPSSLTLTEKGQVMAGTLPMDPLSTGAAVCAAAAPRTSAMHAMFGASIPVSA